MKTILRLERIFTGCLIKKRNLLNLGIMRGFLKGRIWQPIVKKIKMGISPKQLALSLSLGIIIGLIPFYGLTTVIVGGIAFGFRLNFAAAQIAHYIVHPIQIALYIPFLKAGSIFYSKDLLPHNIKEFMGQMKTDFLGTMQDFWIANLAAMLLWIIVAIPLGISLFYLFLNMLRRYVPAYEKRD